MNPTAQQKLNYAKRLTKHYFRTAIEDGTHRPIDSDMISEIESIPDLIFEAVCLEMKAYIDEKLQLQEEPNLYQEYRNRYFEE